MICERNESLRSVVLEAAKMEYGTEPEYPWKGAPQDAVLRHRTNRKWYALFMRIDGEKLNPPESGMVDILNVKCDPMMIGSLRTQAGFYPAYHMNKDKWITILLDGTVVKDTILSMMDMSFGLTASGGGNKRVSGNGPVEWIVPANPKYYDVEEAFEEEDTILWKQSNRIAVGDLVYLYMTAPVASIMYQCKAVEVDIPYSYEDENLSMKRAMRIQLLHKYKAHQFDRELMKEHGIYAVRSPRYMPESLSLEINHRA